MTALLVFITSVFLAYDKLQFRNYTVIIPQWAGFLLAGITFSFVAVDQILRGFVRLEEEQQRLEAAERETRRARIEARYRAVFIRFLLDPSLTHRGRLADILALLEEYRDIVDCL